MEQAVCHLNIVGFKAAVAAKKDGRLKGRPYVIAGSSGGRSLALDCSPEAIRQGVSPGMTLALAHRRIKDLIVLPPDIPAYELMNAGIEKVASRYAPVWENDRAGNLYLDITGTSSLFGPPVDCSCRVLRDILNETGISPAAAVACNKLVSKVATRAIRPVGLIQIQAGTEADFLKHQDVRLLPGMGRSLLKTAEVTGIREIGEIAALSQAEALSLFGKSGILLRNMALGIDLSPVENLRGNRGIAQSADFNEDIIDEEKIMAAMEVLSERGGLKMRNGKLGMMSMRLTVIYSDGLEAHGFEKTKRLLVTDSEIMQAACNLYKKTAVRRIRIKSVKLGFEDLMPLGYQPDLFEPETETKNRRLQEAVDRIQNRFGEGKVTRGRSLINSK